MFIPQLYIEGSRCDLYGDETIQVTDSVRNLMSPDTFLTTYTQQFSLPATARNNGIFSHYYNPDVVGGFNGAIRHDAELRINGLVFRTGQIKLNEITIKHGQPSSYSIVFYGDMARIKEDLRNAKLRSLGSLQTYNHAYTGANVKNGFEIGLTETAGVIGTAASVAAADIIYPFISHTGQYVIDSSVTGNVYKLLFDGNDVLDTTTQLDFRDFKPAIRLTDIISAIETEFDITFDTSGILGDAQFGNLWMWCHAAEGGIIGEDENQSLWSFSDRTFFSDGGANTDLTFGLPYFTIAGLSGDARYDFSLEVTVTGAGNYDVYVDNAYGYGSLYEENNLSGTQTLTWTVRPNEGNNYVAPWVYVISEGTITALDIELTVDFVNNAGTTVTGVYTYVGISPIDEVNIPVNMPDISCLDFLTGICKMFNLVIYRQNGVYFLDTLNSFYTGKSTRDITNYVDSSEERVMPPTPFDDIEFKFEESDSYLIDKRRELVEENYGDESFQLGSIFEDNDFEIEVPFEKILFERMTDINDDTLETWVWAWSADSKEDPYIGAPVIFHADGQIPSAPAFALTWEHGGTSSQQVFSSNTVNDGTDWTLTFGSELGEYTQQPISGDLFTEYWEDYITGVYDDKARKIVLNAWLPPSFMSQFDLGDTIIYRNRSYFINELTINLLTGESELELVTKWL